MTLTRPIMRWNKAKASATHMHAISMEESVILFCIIDEAATTNVGNGKRLRPVRVSAPIVSCATQRQMSCLQWVSLRNQRETRR
jgi:hypothetical protein